ncbi:tetratricopeptide repeat protein [Nitrospiraceae bacterium HYJII51-Mn-bac16s-1-B09]|uniref:Tetratricopeptide repeat protein n=1 Tax=Candidatus Manganitrophus noduliformans TaxID=2606439 RepID=A0A7X6ICD9_9BACT|nr:tetratricopeptide repeat protein [Candidatus Manganitrophus noduliformans]
MEGISLSSDKSSIIEKAQKLAAKGQIDKAIEEWQKLIAETPNDGNIYNTIGDLHLKANHTKEAIAAYLKAADAFRGAGFELKSIAVFKKIVKIDPTRMDVYEKLADVHAERGLVANAAEDYLKVAKHYAKEGDMQSSIAVYRKLANLDPKNFAVRQKLAEICQKWGLAKEAIEEYSKVLSIFKDRQMTSEAQEVIDKVMKIDPAFTGTTSSVDENVSAEKSPASIPPPIAEAPPPQEEVSSQEVSLPQEASSPPSPSEPIIPPAVEPAPEEAPPLSIRMEKAFQDGDWSAAEPLVEEVQDQPAEAFAYLSKWVDFFLERDSSPKAFSILQKAVSLAESHQLFSEGRSLIQRYLAANPEQVSAHQLLGESFERSGEEGEAIQCYSKIISLLHQQRSMTDAQAYYEEIQSRLPGISEDAHCRRLFEPEEAAAEEAAIEELPLESLEEPLQAEAAAPVIEEALPELEPAAEELPEPMDINEVSQAPAESVSAESGSAETPESPVEEVSEATFQGHLTEAEVYIKYGLNSKAIEQLTLLRKLAPSREEPHLQLKELYLKEGMREEAVQECLFLSELYGKIDAEDKRTAVLEEMRALDPEGQYRQEAVPEIADEGSAPAIEALDMPAAPTEGIGELSQEVEPLSVLEEGDSSSQEELLQEPDEVKIKLTQAEEYIQEGKKEAAKSLLWEILKRDSGCAEARLMLLNLQAKEKEKKKVSSDVEREVVTDPPPTGEEISFEGLSELEESLDGLLSDEGGEDSSESEQISEEISSEKAEEPAREEYIDLKSIFGEELNTEADDSFDISIPGLEDSINDLKANIQRGHDEQEYETHYNLGIAYKEMGLIPEAIKEFELAFQGNLRFQDASSMLASCYKENGMIDNAVEIIQNALEDPRCKNENVTALKYELAMLYEIQGVLDQAKVLYEQIYLLDPTFRDVAAKKTIKAERQEDTTNPTVSSISEPAKKPKRQDSKKKDRISYL